MCADVRVGDLAHALPVFAAIDSGDAFQGVIARRDIGGHRRNECQCRRCRTRRERESGRCRLQRPAGGYVERRRTLDRRRGMIADRQPYFLRTRFRCGCDDDGFAGGLD